MSLAWASLTLEIDRMLLMISTQKCTRQGACSSQASRLDLQTMLHARKLGDCIMWPGIQEGVDQLASGRRACARGT
jgi:hypothetical protein